MLLMVGGTAAAIKLSTRDAQRIEQHTGLPPEDLTDEDLREAMGELGIQGQPLTDEDRTAIAAEGAAAAPPTQPAPAPTAAPEESYLDELVKLADLRDRGIISDDDFEAKKKQLLGL